ncbi:MAG: DNA adenine methylase, partial [Candidatus Eisenbacteria sp.]|nr:DNA adenine methylase [Candidatus Eisenbacteria bacterium]
MPHDIHWKDRNKLMPTRSRKLAIWGSLAPYLGGKRRLCPTIFREIDRIVPRRHWPGLVLLDGFLGGGAVSLFGKAQGLRIIATDIAERSVIVGQALIQNSRVILTREDVLRIAAPSDAPPGKVEETYTPDVFTIAQARVLDRALALAGETRDVAKAALLRLLAIRVMLLAHPMSQVRAGNMAKVTDGQFDSVTQTCLPNYIAGLRLTRVDRLWQLAQRINGGVFAGTARVLKTDILSVLSDIPASIVYLDPPYPGTSSYEREYKVIDEILEGRSLPVSPFSKTGGAALLDRVFEKARHIPVWALSLGNAEVTIAELEAKMRRHGRLVRSISIKYPHKASVAAKESRER